MKRVILFFVAVAGLIAQSVFAVEPDSAESLRDDPIAALLQPGVGTTWRS